MVVYALCHFGYKTQMNVVNRTNINKGWIVIGEWYRDTQCTSNMMLFFLMVCWIPTLVIFLWVRIWK